MEEVRGAAEMEEEGRVAMDYNLGTKHGGQDPPHGRQGLPGHLSN